MPIIRRRRFSYSKRLNAQPLPIQHPDDARSLRRLKAVENERDRTVNRKYWADNSQYRQSTGNLVDCSSQSKLRRIGWVLRRRSDDKR